MFALVLSILIELHGILDVIVNFSRPCLMRRPVRNGELIDV